MTFTTRNRSSRAAALGFLLLASASLQLQVLAHPHDFFDNSILNARAALPATLPLALVAREEANASSLKLKRRSEVEKHNRRQEVALMSRSSSGFAGLEARAQEGRDLEERGSDTSCEPDEDQGGSGDTSSSSTSSTDVAKPASTPASNNNNANDSGNNDNSSSAEDDSEECDESDSDPNGENDGDQDDCEDGEDDSGSSTSSSPQDAAPAPSATATPADTKPAKPIVSISVQLGTSHIKAAVAIPTQSPAASASSDNGSGGSDNSSPPAIPAPSADPTPATSGSSTGTIATPSNLSAGSFTPEEGCIRYHTVLDGEVCLGVLDGSKDLGLTLWQFYCLNPQVDDVSCSNLETGQAYCTGYGGEWPGNEDGTSN